LARVLTEWDPGRSAWMAWGCLWWRLTGFALERS
jgi:hypothetical protein